jgi:hypothetical protein
MNSERASGCNDQMLCANFPYASMIQKAAEHLRSVAPVLGRLAEKIGPLSAL